MFARKHLWKYIGEIDLSLIYKIVLNCIVSIYGLFYMSHFSRVEWIQTTDNKASYLVIHCLN